MALKEQDIVLTTQDASGNTVIQMPITRVENVEGAVKTVNGTTPDESGDVAIDLSGYLPVSGGTVLGDLTVSGTLKGATIQSTSDIRKKSDLEKIGACLDKLDKLTAYTYNLVGDSSGRRAGVIAQDVEKVLPEAVRKDKDGFLMLDYNGVIALLLGAFKELRDEVKEMKK